MNLIEHFRRLFASRPDPVTSEDSRRLLAEFAARYSCFRDLLAANQRALEAIAELEQVRGEPRPPSMGLVRGRSTAAVVNVYRMIKGLDALAPDRYAELYDSFEAIKAALDRVLGPAPRPAEGALVLPLEQINRSHEQLTGPKMAILGEVSGVLGLATPPGLVITVAAYHRFLAHNQLTDEITRLLQIADLEQTDQLFATCSEIQGLFISGEVPPEVAAAVEVGLVELAGRTKGRLRLALRSSALGEDAPGASSAGQFRSELNVTPESWPLAYKEVIASLYSATAVAYRRHHGLRDEEAAMAVGCLAMIEPVAGGVVYTADPLDYGRKVVLIDSCWGLPKAVVDGAWTCDRIEVEPGPPLRLLACNPARKERRYVCQPEEGVLSVAVEPGLIDSPSLSEAQALELAAVALKLEAHFGGPQDVEWALDQQQRLVILQSRSLPMAVGRAEVPLVTGSPEQVILHGGVTASPGAAVGPVRWVLTGGDAVAFQAGEVLAVEQPLPRWAPLLGKAAALVGLEGGVAGHLASVAREFQLPALLGLGPEGKRVAQGQEVTVDASGRTIFQGRLELPGKVTPSASQPDTPLHRTVEAVLALTSRLNLLDSEDRGFRPEACRTLHDITRFCHQKAVEEMFSQATSKHFPLHAARQLYVGGPMLWWVLDLDDGLHGPPKGKYVHLEDIACAPFHALWAGLTAVPWEGPPALDARGMTAVMFEATANPALSSEVGGRMGERNYFLITKNFLNMQSQVGFHFSSLEAMVTGQAEENFVSFCFRGGAADADRRRARLGFLEEFLAGLGMAVSIKGDALLARTERLGTPAALALIKALGYLTMHTRQLDVIMANPRRVAYYRNKITADLASFASASVANPDVTESCSS